MGSQRGWFCRLPILSKDVNRSRIDNNETTMSTKNNVFATAYKHKSKNNLSNQSVDSQALYFVCFVPFVVQLLVFS